MHQSAPLLVTLFLAITSHTSSTAVMESLIRFLVENLYTKNIIRKYMLATFYIVFHHLNFNHNDFKAFYPRIYLLKTYIPGSCRL